MGRVVGIDLGTSTSCVSIVETGQPRVLPGPDQQLIQASVVSFLEDGRIIVGNEAKNFIIENPERTVYSAKRLIGRKFFSSEVKKASAVSTFRIVEGPNQSVRIQIGERQYSCPEISAMILMEMKRIAEAALGEEVDQAVITVPANFNDGQRQATKDAGTIAGLNVLRIINEPTAAALAYGFGKDLRQKIAVYDLGGGTFDISILEIGNDVFEVISTAGDMYLGGDDFDDRLIDYMAEMFMREHDIDLRTDRHALQRLKDIAERSKIQLSTDLETRIHLPAIVEKDGKSLDLDISINRNYFGQMVHDLIQRTFKVCDEALQNGHLTVDDIDALILVGGPTKMPIVREAAKSYFFKEPKADIDPELVVSLGASIQASALVESSAGALLLDVTPMSLGIETAGGLMDTLIERNTPIPTEQSRIFTTIRDNQTAVKIRIFQGEQRFCKDNELLGEFRLTDLPAALKGDPKIEVTFEIDANGIVNVTARDRDTGKARSVQLNVSGGLSKEEIEKLKAEHSGAEGVAVYKSPHQLE
ncbi:MAG TPA: molecular chaperone DnaK [bacterium]|nr:molecular chaperone DnaK [bacterium]